MKSRWILGTEITTALALGLIACGGGGGGPSSPTAPTTPPTATGTTLTIVSGETDGPVSGARVTVDGATFTTNSAGQVTLPQRPADMAPVDILAAGYLDRLTVFRGQDTRLSLWPRTSRTGLTEADTINLVYTHVNWRGAPPLYQIGAVGGDSLRQRSSRAPVQVFYSDGFDGADSRAIDTQAAAVVELNGALGGGLTYLPPSFAAIPAGNTGELHVALTIDPTHESCAAGFAATGEFPPAGMVVNGILRVNYCSTRYAGNLHVAIHELAQTFGLRHSADEHDVMCPGSGIRAFTPKEKLVMRLMLQRRPGNIFPDTDACRWRPEWCVD